MLGTEAWDRDEASRLIAYDAELSAKILRAANDGASSSLGSADAAVSRLGQGKVVALAVANSLRQPFSEANPILGLAESELWRHAVAAAFAVERMQGHLAQPIPHECLAAALLHDLGYLVFARTLPTDVQLLLAKESKQGWTISRQAEHELAGTDHATVGGAIAGHWGLPPVFVDAIAHHHTPNQISIARFAHVAHVVNIADMVAATIGESLGKREQGPIDEGGEHVEAGAQRRAILEHLPGSSRRLGRRPLLVLLSSLQSPHPTLPSQSQSAVPLPPRARQETLCSRVDSSLRALGDRYRTPSSPVPTSPLRSPDRIVKLSIVIPVYNEEKTLRELVSRVQATPHDQELILGH